jgi:hypothetical protein
MARKYVLRDWDDHDPLKDPHAPWRKEPASERQSRRIEFFTGRRMGGLTKGKAGAIIDKLNEDTNRLADYERWKLSGEPDIQTWRREHGMSAGVGCFGVVGRFFLGVCVVSVVLAAVGYFVTRSKQTGGVVSQKEETFTPVPSKRTREQPTPSQAAKATPRPLPTDASAIAAQRRAMTAFPQLAVKNSALNRAFVARVRRYQTEKPAVFDDPDWPTQIAAECVEALGGK